MKMKSIVMLAASSLLAASVAYIAPAMADEPANTQETQAPADQAASSNTGSATDAAPSADASSATANSNADASSATGSSNGDANSAPASSDAVSTPSESPSPDTTSGDDDY